MDKIFPGVQDQTLVLVACVRLVVAVILGAILGYERQYEGKSAGLRTHMLVSLGSALFVLAPLQAGATMEHMTRVFQGLTTGIGFLGAGTILKHERQVKGLTTAANIWLTAAVGMAVGIGLVWPAVLGVGLALIILFVLRWIEPWIEPHNHR